MEPENIVPSDNQLQLGENYNTNACPNCQNWKKQYETKFDQLTESVNQLKVTIEGLAAIRSQQNQIIMEALAKQEMLTETLFGGNIEVNVRKIFPIQSVDDLEETNNKIEESDRAVYTRCMSSLLKGQLHKSLTEIFSVEVIIASNIDGIHGKLALKNYKMIFETLMDAIRANGEVDPEKALRKALKLIKKRHFHSICVNKKRETQVNNNDRLEATHSVFIYNSWPQIEYDFEDE